MKKRALVLCDDAWHPADLVQHGLGALDTPFNFDFITRGDDWSSTVLKEFSAVVVAKANHLCATDQSPWLTHETQSGIRNFVRSGGGVFLIHSGMCYRDLPEIRAVAGGAFLSHPDPCSVTVKPKLGNPLTVGATTFTVEDEHYFMALDVHDADIFLHTHSQHGTQPAGWIRTEGEGRVCVLTPGHNPEVWAHREYQTLLRNGFAWLAK